MKKDIYVELQSHVQCQKIPDGIHIRLENQSLPNWKQEKNFEKISFFGKKVSSSRKSSIFCIIIEIILITPTGLIRGYS